MHCSPERLMAMDLDLDFSVQAKFASQHRETPADVLESSECTKGEWACRSLLPCLFPRKRRNKYHPSQRGLIVDGFGTQLPYEVHTGCAPFWVHPLWLAHLMASL